MTNDDRAVPGGEVRQPAQEAAESRCPGPDLAHRLARLQPGSAERHRPCGCGPYDPYTANEEEWRACGCVISHLYVG